jgi:hypothetical protein
LPGKVVARFPWNPSTKAPGARARLPSLRSGKSSSRAEMRTGRRGLRVLIMIREKLVCNSVVEKKRQQISSLEDERTKYRKRLPIYWAVWGCWFRRAKTTGCRDWTCRVLLLGPPIAAWGWEILF